MIYLAFISALAVAASAGFLVIYGRVADWGDPVAVNAWFGGVGALILSAASGLYVAGHYGVFGGDDYREAFLVACAGFTVVAAVWAHRAWIVLVLGERPWWKVFTPPRGGGRRSERNR